MQRSFPPRSWLHSWLLLATPGCLVSFNDYPLGELRDDFVSPGGSGGVAGGGGGNSSGDSGASATNTGGEGGDGVLPQVNDNLLDDFEDGNGTIAEVQGRSAGWYVANDGRGQQTPQIGERFLPSLLEPPRDESFRGAHTYGGPFQTWGALIGTSFVSTGFGPRPYDVSAYQGMRLWVRSGLSSRDAGAKQVLFNLRTSATVMGGGCTVCDDHFGTPIPLTSAWEQIEVPFSTMKQRGFGRPTNGTLDLKEAIGIELLFPANVTFDLWIDDVEFY